MWVRRNDWPLSVYNLNIDYSLQFTMDIKTYWKQTLRSFLSRKLNISNFKLVFIILRKRLYHLVIQWIRKRHINQKTFHDMIVLLWARDEPSSNLISNSFFINLSVLEVTVPCRMLIYAHFHPCLSAIHLSLILGFQISAIPHVLILSS